MIHDYILTEVVYGHESLRLAELLSCQLQSRYGHNYKIKFHKSKLIMTNDNNDYVSTKLRNLLLRKIKEVPQLKIQLKGTWVIFQ